MLTRIGLALGTFLLALALLVSASTASAPPVGALPPGQLTTVDTAKGTLVALALPGQSPSSGLVWRLARTVNGSVLRQKSERDVGRDVVLVYRTVGRGTATVAYGLTKGETKKAYKSVTYKIHVR
jgi:hypothetical protein